MFKYTEVLTVASRVFMVVAVLVLISRLLALEDRVHDLEVKVNHQPSEDSFKEDDFKDDFKKEEEEQLNGELKKMTMKELKSLAKENNIPFSRSTTKSELIQEIVEQEEKTYSQ